MERGKTGAGRGSKNKQVPLPSDFIALGSKSTRGDVADTKRPGGGLVKTTTTTTTTSNYHT